MAIDEWVQISPYHLAEEVLGNTNFHAFFGDYYRESR